MDKHTGFKPLPKLPPGVKAAGDGVCITAEMNYEIIGPDSVKNITVDAMVEIYTKWDTVQRG